MSQPPRLIQFLVFPAVNMLDLSGPLRVFATANELLAFAGQAAAYDVTVIAAQAPLLSCEGLEFNPLPLPDVQSPCDTLLVIGGQGVGAACRDGALPRWIGQRAPVARRLVSICNGAFLLAAAGLLDGRRAVTHWSRCEALARRFPLVRVEPDSIFVNDGPIWTSAGVTAGIDLALALVEEDLGHELALEIARYLVVFLKRPGGQAQFSVPLFLQHRAGGFAQLHAWITEHVAQDLSVAVLAQRMGMSERSFLRHYREQTGTTPAKAVERIRVEAARQLLDETPWPLKRIALRCGLGSEATFRRAFQRVFGINAQDYRQRFSSRDEAKAQVL
ncbi:MULTISPECIES: helix-turn-helix domain-containing protein [Pseudomonas]|uniref:Helix-turn-helix domain-containing protein n=1 Tax=Pseudomonas sessilinigenes TaxID=658629 RepID=A0ABX8MQY8_9PSED|nr:MULTISPECIES: helix-turn-helix domain-containing protein [Pseudomonas]AZC22657.1 Transcriptional regulator, AraC family [Pseudomonas sessilinigenes]QIH06246.1 helix-turn-helix domain-containing protein [Pseudomonas sp. BIOMIG1BAC]QXH41705.1 helix-turn-helix domain-containing protein [Pseudomonas sessilinigenes]